MTIEELAEIMHDKMCRWNHTDGCTWLYEKDGAPIPAQAHSIWLVKAKNALKVSGLDAEAIAKVIKAL